MPKKGTYIFGDDKSQFLPVGSTKWQAGNKDAELEENSPKKFFQKCPNSKPELRIEY